MRKICRIKVIRGSLCILARALSVILKQQYKCNSFSAMPWVSMCLYFLCFWYLHTCTVLEFVHVILLLLLWWKLTEIIVFLRRKKTIQNIPLFIVQQPHMSNNEVIYQGTLWGMMTFIEIHTFMLIYSQLFSMKHLPISFDILNVLYMFLTLCMFCIHTLFGFISL